jgi:hypothetical protein
MPGARCAGAEAAVPRFGETYDVPLDQGLAEGRVIGLSPGAGAYQVQILFLEFSAGRSS